MLRQSKLSHFSLTFFNQKLKCIFYSIKFNFMPFSQFHGFFYFFKSLIKSFFKNLNFLIFCILFLVSSLLCNYLSFILSQYPISFKFLFVHLSSEIDLCDTVFQLHLTIIIFQANLVPLFIYQNF